MRAALRAAGFQVHEHSYATLCGGFVALGDVIVLGLDATAGSPAVWAIYPRLGPTIPLAEGHREQDLRDVLTSLFVGEVAA